MDKSNWIKVIGLAATAIGMAATIINNWVDEKKMDEKIDKKVNEALAQMQNEGGS